MPDLPLFFQAVRGLMHSGAQLVIYETHPVLEMFKPRSDHLRRQRLQEHPHLNREVDYAIDENQPAQMPLCYTLVAETV